MNEPNKVPDIKLVPIINEIGKFIVSRNKSLTCLFWKLFCIEIINKINKERLNKKLKIIFFSLEFILC